MGEVSQFYSSRKQSNNAISSKASGGGASSAPKDKEKDKEREKEKEKPAMVGQKKPLDVPRKDAACTKRSQELMRQFGTILRQARYYFTFFSNCTVTRFFIHI